MYVSIGYGDRSFQAPPSALTAAMGGGHHCLLCAHEEAAESQGRGFGAVQALSPSWWFSIRSYQ